MIFLLIIIAIATLFFFLHFHYEYWKRRGVPGPKPSYIIGNMGPSFLVKKSQAQVFEDVYKAYPNSSMVGIFRASTPALVLRNPDLIKDVTVRSFGNFHDNDLYVDKDVDPLFGRNPFVLRGEEWKTTRQHLTPGFTSGKMKWIYPLLEDVSQQLVKYIENHPTAFNGKGCNAKDLCMRFTLNNVGNCAYGLEAKCFIEEYSEFQQIADRFVSPAAWQKVKVFIVTLIPVLNNMMNIKFTPRDVEEKLMNMIQQTIKYREENNIERNDFLQILYNLKKTSKDFSFTDIDITAHSAGFFADGYETSSIVMSFLLYVLAANPKQQTKLRDEINQAFEKNNGKLPYEVLQSLPYLDGAFNESLRLHSPLGVLAKICTKDYVYTPKDGDSITKPVTIEKGTSILVPLYGLHRDPKFFDEPDSFKPERFVGANKENITKYSFMPFGEGPRACLGQRFGVLQVKIGIAYIIRNYEISVNKKTQEPIEYDPTYFLTIAKNGLWVDFKKIS